jgi:6-phosphogluconate dehydrogenase
MADIYFVMGVSGSGKTTVGQLLSEKIHLPFFDADDFHSLENKAKMKAGIPLNDEDRVSWLAALNELAIKQSGRDGAIIACSALKEKYRSLLSKNLQAKVYWIVLIGEYDLLLKRMQARQGHYMPAGLLQSQLETMEYPPYGMHIHIDQSPENLIHQILTNKDLAEFGVLGLGVMGKSLARNLGSKGMRLALFNQNIPGKEEKVAEKAIATYPELSLAIGFDQIPDFIHSLARPRKIFIMVPAGQIVDAVIHELKPFLNPGDVIMDGGNSHFKDTERRQQELLKDQIHFIGIGVSGGEQGALHGPAIMPGGNHTAYQSVESILNAIAAKDKSDKPCSGYIGAGGAGHFVKMIHNGIEYAEMQLIAEVYWILKCGLKKSNEEIAVLFESWYEGPLSSYLLEITIKVLRHQTEGEYTVDLIADIGGSKGTGGWSLTAAAELGIPATLIADALFARYISSFKEDRIFFGSSMNMMSQKDILIDTNTLKNAYTLARWINHHQGIEIIQSASVLYKWNLNLSETTRIWTSGCIIRSVMMEEISVILKNQVNILKSKTELIHQTTSDLIEAVTKPMQARLAAPCLASSLNYLLAYTSAELPTNLIQAQRDFFGAHTYRKTGDPFGKSYHTEWE